MGMCALETTSNRKTKQSQTKPFLLKELSEFQAYRCYNWKAVPDPSTTFMVGRSSSAVCHLLGLSVALLSCSPASCVCQAQLALEDAIKGRLAVVC